MSAIILALLLALPGSGHVRADCFTVREAEPKSILSHVFEVCHFQPESDIDCYAMQGGLSCVRR